MGKATFYYLHYILSALLKPAALFIVLHCAWGEADSFKPGLTADHMS